MKRADLLGVSFDCECGRHHSVPTKRFILERGAINSVADVVGQLELGSKAFLLADPTTFDVAGRRVQDVLEGAGVGVHTFVLPEHPKACDETIQAVRDAHQSGEFIVTCGSGTITDLGKHLANERKLPLLAVATAPSMNGYASSVVALMRNGIKITEPVRPAIAVIADLDVLANAPIEMIRAGLGDALAKPVCNADWKLASLVRDVHFCSVAFELVHDLETTYTERAQDIGMRDFDAIRTLAEALMYSGVSMVLAGSSAPASGGEHLISHTLDMRAAIAGRSADFHGAQVGVGTLITSQLYEHLFEMSPNDVRDILLAGEGPHPSEVEKRVQSFFGPIADAILGELHKKTQSSLARRDERIKIAQDWEMIRAEVAPYLMPSVKIRKALSEAGCKTTHSELGVGGEEFCEAVYLARTIRPRFNVLDVAWELGLLDDFVREVT
jgi:glycerol-1-phosphate dehydrogenase [NAD(P)+]